GMTGPTQFGDGPTHDLLGTAVRVALGVVEEVHPRRTGRIEAVPGEAGVELGTERDPGSEREHAHPQSTASEPAIRHLRHGPAMVPVLALDRIPPRCSVFAMGASDSRSRGEAGTRLVRRVR